MDKIKTFFIMASFSIVLIFLLYCETRHISSPVKYLFKGPDKVDLNSTGSVNVGEEDWIEISGAETHFFVVDLTEQKKSQKRFSSKTITDIKYKYSVLMDQADPMVKKWEPVRNSAAEILKIKPDSVDSPYSGEVKKYISLINELNEGVEKFKKKGPVRYVLIKKYVDTDSYSEASAPYHDVLKNGFKTGFLNPDLNQKVKDGIKQAGEFTSSMNKNSTVRGIVEEIPDNVKQQYKTWLQKDPQFAVFAGETPKWRKLFTVPILLLALLFALREMYRNFSGLRELFRPPGY